MPCIFRGAVLTLVICIFSITVAHAHSIHHTHKAPTAAVFHMKEPVVPSFEVAVPTDFSSYFEVSSGINLAHGSELSRSGASTLSLSGVEGVGTSVTLGVSNSSGLATELEYSFRSGAADVSVGGSFLEGYLQSHTFMANAVLRVKTPESSIQPYFGGGVGYLLQDAEIANFEGSGETLAYQGFVGARMQFSEQAAATLEYKYQTTPDFDLDFAGALGTYTLDAASNSTIQIGVQMAF